MFEEGLSVRERKSKRIRALLVGREKREAGGVQVLCCSNRTPHCGFKEKRRKQTWNDTIFRLCFKGATTFVLLHAGGGSLHVGELFFFSCEFFLDN